MLARWREVPFLIQTFTEQLQRGRVLDNIRNIGMLLGGVVYVLSPLDLVPEAVFGLIGFLDDAAVFFFIIVMVADRVKDALVQINN